MNVISDFEMNINNRLKEQQAKDRHASIRTKKPQKANKPLVEEVNEIFV
jgi:hypothetical protein